MTTHSLFATRIYAAPLQRQPWQAFNERLRQECLQLQADDAAGRHFQAQHRITGRGKLMNEFFGCRPPVPDAGVVFVKNDHAA